LAVEREGKKNTFPGIETMAQGSPDTTKSAGGSEGNSTEKDPNAWIVTWSGKGWLRVTKIKLTSAVLSKLQGR